MSWQALKDIYHEQGLVLASGAGVSFDSNLPNWIGLLSRIGNECLDAKGVKLVDELISKGFSLPSIASMLKTKCPPDRRFADIVRAALYRDFEPYRQRDVSGVDLKKLVKDVCDKNHTLRTVAALCAKWDERSASFSRNNKIHAILNFNLDATLREYVEARYERVLVRSIERPSKSSDPKKINIYYMHGFLRFDSKVNDPGKEAFDKLVLAEQEYFDFFNSPTGLFNYTFLYLLREYPCLFIGLSMQDENIRRLLHYSKKERETAYSEEKEGSHKIKEKVLRHFAIVKRYDSTEVNDLVELSLAELGTNVLWIAGYEEIPRQLGLVYGSNWDKVY